MSFKAVVEGYEELQAANRKLLAAVRPEGALGAANLYATKSMLRGVEGRVHTDTGTYKASLRAEFTGLVGRVYVAPNRNPKSGAIASMYAKHEEARGGSHAAFANTARQDEQRVAQEATQLIVGALP